MGAGAKAYQVAGDCASIPVNICMPFKEFCIHTLASSPSLGQPTNPEAGTFGCGAYNTTAGTQFINDPKIPSAVNRAPVYGQTTATKTMPYYFQTAGLAPWKSRSIIGAGDPYQKKASGPAVQQAHMVTEVRRRLRNGATLFNGNYQNRNQFYFTDASAPISNQPDWMGMLHPAGFFWSNKGLDEPFLADDFYESTGQTPTLTDNYNQNLIPFCTPVNAYDADGVLLGQFIGYTLVYYFAFAYVKLPITGFKPDDHHSTLPTPPKVNPTYQFFSIDCHVYMVASPASGKVLQSPRLNATRYWFYNKNGTTWNVCDQYMYLINGSTTSNWKFDVIFNLVGGGSDTIKFGLSNFQVYLTP